MKELTDWQQRVTDEKVDLDVRLLKLQKYIEAVEFSDLGDTDQQLLTTQCAQMEALSETLGERIKRFDVEEE